MSEKSVAVLLLLIGVLIIGGSILAAVSEEPIRCSEKPDVSFSYPDCLPG